MKNKILVAIPCYNCAAQVGRVLAGLEVALSGQAEFEQIFLIDNRSEDQTIQAAAKALEPLSIRSKTTIIRNRSNYGLGGTHKVAFELARTHSADWLCILHGDAQADPADIPPLLRVVGASTELAAVLGSRFSAGSRLEGYSRIRTIGNRLLNLCYSLLSLRRTEDLGSGLNLFRVQSYPSELLQRCADGFTFNMDLLLESYSASYRLQFLPITWREEDQRSNAVAWRVGLRSFLTLLRWRFGMREVRPIREYSYEVVSAPSSGAS